MRLVVRNRSDRTVVVPFNSGQHVDFEVLQEDRLIWSWSRDRAFTQALTTLTLKPREEAVFAARWDMENARGREVNPGRYLVRGIVTASFREPALTDEKVITIRQR